MISDEAITRIQQEFQEHIDLYGEDSLNQDVSRRIFKRLWSGIKTVASKVADFMVKPYSINGKVYYKYNGKELPAYGVNVKKYLHCRKIR